MGAELLLLTWMTAVAGDLEEPPAHHWERQLPGPRPSVPFRSALAGDEEHLFLGHVALNELLMLKSETGELLSRFSTAAPVEGRVQRLPEGDLLFADTSGTTWRYAADGSLRWSHFGGAPVTTAISVGDDEVFVSNVDDVLYALDLESGELRWRYQRPEELGRDSELTLFGSPAPVWTGELLLAGFSDGVLVAMDPVLGEVLWEKSVGQGRYPDLIATPVVSEGDVLIGGFSEPFLSMDLDTRNVRWRLDLGAAAAPLVEGEQIFHPGVDGKLRAIHRLNGEVLWTWDSESSAALGQPQLTTAGILLASSDGRLTLIDPDTGILIWEEERLLRPSGYSAAPLILDNRLIALSHTGRLLSLRVPLPAAPRELPGPGAGAPM